MIRSEALPDEAYAAVLAGLPEMTSETLAALLGVTDARTVWSWLSSAHATHAALDEAVGTGCRDLLDTWRGAATSINPRSVWHGIVRAGVGVSVLGRPRFPPALSDDVAPPTVLFHRGHRNAITGARVAIVGTRRCTSTGRGIAFELGRDLATEQITVVTGLDRGIGDAAHRGALWARGAPPVGVVPYWLGQPSPPAHYDLWQQATETGLLLSEAPPGAPPTDRTWFARNRIIAALVDVVVVVEAHAEPDELHTANQADHRAIPVMAVPGTVRSPASQGTNDLLAHGKPLVRHAGDVLALLHGRQPSTLDRVG